MDTQSIIFFIIFGLVGFLILYLAFTSGAWSKYHKIDEKILDLKGEIVKATLNDYKLIKDHPKRYEIRMEYTDSAGLNHLATPASYCNEISTKELNYLKKQDEIEILAFEDLCEIDFSAMPVPSNSSGENDLIQTLKFIFPMFKKRGGFPPHHKRKELLKQLEAEHGKN